MNDQRTSYQRMYDTLLEGPVTVRQLNTLFLRSQIHVARDRTMIIKRGDTYVLHPDAVRPANGIGRPRTNFDQGDTHKTNEFDWALIDYLSSGPKRYQLIERKLRTNYPRLKRAKARLGIVVDREGKPPHYHTVWRLPENFEGKRVINHPQAAQDIIRKVANGTLTDADIALARELIK